MIGRLALWILVGLGPTVHAHAEENQRITTIEMVEILGDHEAEAMHYFQNNWAKFRATAKSEGAIADYALHRTEADNAHRVDIILTTIYASEAQYAAREESFRRIINAAEGLDLLNDIKPPDFRRSVLIIDRMRKIVP